MSRNFGGQYDFSDLPETYSSESASCAAAIGRINFPRESGELRRLARLGTRQCRDIRPDSKRCDNIFRIKPLFRPKDVKPQRRHE